MTTLGSIPINFYGVVVGTMAFHDDGSVEIESSEPSAMGIDLKGRFEAQEYNGMTLIPNGVPMPPPPPPAENPDPEPEQPEE